MKKEWTMEETVKMPVIALRGLTVFPNVLIHFDVSREISIKALEEAMASGDPVFLVGQKDIGVEYPEAKDLYTVGTVSNVRQILRTPGDNVRVMVEGGARGSLKRLLRSAPFLEAEVQPIQEEKAGQNSAKTEALIRSTYEMFRQYTELAPKTAPDLLINVLASEDPGYIADFIAQNIAMRNSDKQAILEELRPVRRLERLYRLLTREVEILGLDMEIQNRAREQMADNQRDYYLREQMKAIQAELGEGEGSGDSEIGDYRKKIAEAKLPDEVREKLEKELGRLAKQPFGSSEATVLRSYLDVCLELPWGKKTKERVSVEAARKAKFTNLSLDLIYGLPGQTMESWKATVEHALSLIPQHLSCYGLKVEEGTPLARRAAEGEILPDDDQQADLYLWTVGRLERAGYPQYEISNFAKPGYESRHNLRYWLTRPYIGFGPGAHSDFGGRRYSFVRDLDAYIRGVLEGGDIIDSSELIPQRERCGEYLMLRLRTVRGVDGREYRHTYFMDFAPLEARLREFAAQGWAEETDGRWHFTPKGFLVSNQLIGDLLERQEQASWEDLIRPRQDQA